MSQVFQTSRIILIIYLKIKIICSPAYIIAQIPFLLLVFLKIPWKCLHIPEIPLVAICPFSSWVTLGARPMSPPAPHDCLSMMRQLSLICFTPKLKLALLPKKQQTRAVDVNENDSNFLKTHFLPDSLPNAVCIFVHWVFTDSPIGRHYYYLHFKNRSMETLRG